MKRLVENRVLRRVSSIVGIPTDSFFWGWDGGLETDSEPQGSRFLH